MKLQNSIDRNITVLLVCLAMIFTGQLSYGQQVKSDFEIQKDFKLEVKSINVSLDSVGSVAGAKQIIDRVKSLERNYGEYEQLLDKVLYPETFDQRMEELKKHTVSVHQRLATIEQMDDRLEELTGLLASYETRLQELNENTDSLQMVMKKSVRSEKELSDQVRTYRQNLEQRDQLILSIIDSVLVAYRDLNIESLENMENASEMEHIAPEGNPLKLIQTIAEENVQILDSNPNLSTGDYLRMNAVQKEFSIMWNRVGVKLTDVYADDPSAVRSNIESSISTWNTKVDEGLWTSMHDSFAQAGIELKEFGSSSAMASAINSYVNQGVTSSKENGSAKARKNFQNFSEFWNQRVKAGWGEFLTRGQVLTTQQMATVDQKLDQWAGMARPASNTFAYLFGISILAVVVLGVMLFREKSNNGSEHSKAKM